jgi:uncharacterized protein YcbK (DUF882 family)
MKDLDKLWFGLVEDNKDPDRLGRVKVRVQSVFDDIPLEDIPWASPIKTLSARAYEMPAVGKIVSVLFPNDNLYEPYYMYSDHYNTNLGKKLTDLSDDEYVGFVALVFDQRTKVYSDDTELTMDYLYNKITITNDNINLELKDNNRKLNLGCQTASQQAVLGNHWFDWFDKFVACLVKPNSLIGNLNAPVLKSELEQLLVEYQLKRETFVSDHVYIVDDNKVDKLEMKYNSPIMDDGVKINSDSVAGNNFGDENSQNLSQSIKDQKDKELDKLMDAAPSDLKNQEDVKDLTEEEAASAKTEDTSVQNIYSEVVNNQENEITKEEYDAKRAKELQTLIVYEDVDEQQDADDIIYDLEISGQVSEDVITEYEDSNVVFLAPDDSHYVDKTEPKTTTPTEQFTPASTSDCKDINVNNITANMQLSTKFKLFNLLAHSNADSKNFILHGGSSTQNGLSRDQIVCNLKNLCVNCLDGIKTKYPGMYISSSFRTNGSCARSSNSSQHNIGQAVDFQIKGLKHKDYYTVANYVKDYVKNYDQLLLEYRPGHTNHPWIHISYTNGKDSNFKSNRKMNITMYNDKSYQRPGDRGFTNLASTDNTVT